MSDIFDHECDAWDSYEQGLEEDGPYVRGGRGSFDYDPLYYHQKVKFKAVRGATDLAVQLELKGSDKGLLVWVPRSVCRKWGDGRVHIHSKTFAQSLKNARRSAALADLLEDGPV